MNTTRIFRSSTFVPRFVGILITVCIRSTTFAQGEPFQITNFVRGAETLDLGFQAPAGLGYNLQRSTNLTDWVTVTNVSAYSVLSLPRDAQAPMCFFRLQSFLELVVNGAVVPGEIETAGSSDWYRFEVASSAVYSFTVALGTLSDSIMWLYGPNTQTALITTNDDYGNNLWSQITMTLLPGTYFIKINGWGTEMGTYSVQVTK